MVLEQNDPYTASPIASCRRRDAVVIVVGLFFDVGRFDHARLSQHQTPRIGVRLGGLPRLNPRPGDGELVAQAGASYSKH